MKAIFTRGFIPFCRVWMAWRHRLMGMANPMPVAPTLMAVLMPITLPYSSTNGPPEFP